MRSSDDGKVETIQPAQQAIQLQSRQVLLLLVLQLVQVLMQQALLIQELLQQRLLQASANQHPVA